jgi:ubiquinone/menaquinone biosynthesis C-methylase UbiE
MKQSFKPFSGLTLHTFQSFKAPSQTSSKFNLTMAANFHSLNAAERRNFFNGFAQNYIKMSGGVTRTIGLHALSVMPPITSESVVHDNACGPGILTLDILAAAASAGTEPPTIHATDFADGMVNALQSTIDSEGLKTVTARVMDGSDLSPFADEMFTHSLTNFGVFAFPDAIAGVKHIHRTLQPSGTALLTTWKSPGNFHFIHEVQKVIQPEKPLSFFLDPCWQLESKLWDILEAGGFQHDKIRITENTAELRFTDVEEGVQLFSNPFWDKTKEGLTEKQRKMWDELVREKVQGLHDRNEAVSMVAHVAVAQK